MLVLGALCAVAGLCAVAFHMVRPSHRDLRLSMGHLLPNPPPSQAPKQVFSLRSLLTSWLFWLRLLCVALVALALYPMTIQGPAPDKGPQHFRLVLDVSASMAVQDQAGQSRMEDARGSARTALDRMLELRADSPDICIDVALVGGGVSVLAMGEGGQLMNTVMPLPEGSAMATLLSALAMRAPTGCDSTPTHVVVVTDQPPQVVSPALFAGHLMWQQVGAPRDNLAIWTVEVSTGSLRDAAPRIDVRVASFGAVPATASVTVEGPGGTSLAALRRDENRVGGWRADLPFDGAGRYNVTLSDGGALSVDDTITLELGSVDRVAVDWRLPEVPRPAALLQGTGDPSAITVGRYDGVGASLPDGPFVLVYDGWSVPGGGSIGPFMRDHPILDGVNLDVLERLAPRAVAVPAQHGLAHVIRPNAETGTWIALRDTPRGAIVPMTPDSADDDIVGLSKLMFYNALSWVVEGGATVAPQLTHISAEGRAVPNALAESNTARALSQPASLALLAEPVLARPDDAPAPDGSKRDSPMIPWQIGLVLLLILIERYFGFIWAQRGAG